MPLRPGYAANTAQRAIVTILTVDPGRRLVEGMMRDRGMISIGVHDQPSTFRWPKTGEVWYVQRVDNISWKLESRARFSHETSLEEMQEGELRLDSEKITDSQGRDLVAITDPEDGQTIVFVDGEWQPVDLPEPTEGEPGPAGPAGPAGPPGPSGTDTTYIHNQIDSQPVWSVTHFLNKFPSVSIVDSAGTVVYGDVDYINNNELTITFGSPFTGKAYLN